MARIQTDIIQALNDRLSTFSTYASNKRIAWEGITLIPPKDAIWLIQKTLFARPVLLGAFSDAGTYREQGVYQVTVCAPLGTGVIGALEVADAILDYFPRGAQYTSGGVVTKVEKCYGGTGMEDPPYFKVPVSIEFWAYSSYN